MTPGLTNDTLLRSYLAHVQSNVRELAALRLEREAHPDTAGKPYESTLMKAMCTEWENLRRDLVKVVGPEADLKPFGELAAQGTFHPTPAGGQDPFRINFRTLKKMADKARLKDDTITLLKSWDVKAREPMKQAA